MNYLFGNTNGWVYWSNDNGTSFEPLPSDAGSPPLTGSIAVAFDPQFSQNNTVYAASDAPDNDIYRFTIGTSTEWEGIDATLPRGRARASVINQLVLSASGILYATNSQSVDTTNKEGGIERCLDPAYSLEPEFETVTSGLDDGAKLYGLWLSANQLWSIDSANTRLVTYIDNLAVPVTLTSPPNQASGIGTMIGSTIRNISLNWESLSSATSYTWQLDDNADFPSPLKGDTTANSVKLPALEPATTYYWRVRAAEPRISPWSAKWSFATIAGTKVTAPSLKNPGPGVKNVELKPVFKWSTVTGAAKYELLVSTDVSFATTVIRKSGTNALSATTWQCDTDLDYDTTYYWKVRAIRSSSYSAWSAVYAFTTRSPPESSSPEPPSGHLTAPELLNPEADNSGMPPRPVFQWSAVAGADGYELLVSTDVSFANPLIIIDANALLTTTWQCDIDLDCDTTYYWKVRAIRSDSYGAWSTVGTFTTGSPPEPSPPEPPSLSPPPPPVQQITPDWVKWLIFLGGGLLLITLAMLITLIIIITKARRL